MFLEAKFTVSGYFSRKKKKKKKKHPTTGTFIIYKCVVVQNILSKHIEIRHIVDYSNLAGWQKNDKNLVISLNTNFKNILSFCQPALVRCRFNFFIYILYYF